MMYTEEADTGKICREKMMAQADKWDESDISR